MPAVGEHLEPLVEGGNLGLEEDVPFFEEAEVTLFGGGVVAVPPCLDGPGDGEWGACPLQSPHMLALRVKTFGIASEHNCDSIRTYRQS